MRVVYDKCCRNFRSPFPWDVILKFKGAKNNAGDGCQRSLDGRFACAELWPVCGKHVGLAWVPRAGRHPGEHRATCVYGDAADCWVVCSRLGSARSYLSEGSCGHRLSCWPLPRSVPGKGVGGRLLRIRSQALEPSQPSEAPAGLCSGHRAPLLRRLAAGHSFWFASASPGVTKPGGP